MHVTLVFFPALRNVIEVCMMRLEDIEYNCILLSRQAVQPLSDV